MNGLARTLRVGGLTLDGRLRDVSIVLRPGQLTAIVGPNGAGKSTLIASLAGLLAADQGTVVIGDEPLMALRPRVRAQALGYLPQSAEIAWNVSVRTLVSLGRLPWPGAPGGAAIEAALVAMDLAHLAERPVSRLSGGERARALVARVLAGEPEWLLADEPLASLDLAHAASLMMRLRGQAKAGRGVVVVLHDLAQAMNHADRVLVLDSGRLVADGPPQQALAAEILAHVWGVNADWLGTPGAMALALRPASGTKRDNPAG